MLLAESVPCHPGFNSKYLLEKSRKISAEWKPNNDHRDNVTSRSLHSPRELEGPSRIPPDRSYPQRQREKSKECQEIQVFDCCTPYYNNTSAGGNKTSHLTSPSIMTSSRFDEYFTHRPINHKRRAESSNMMQSCQENPPIRILSETQTAMLDTSSYEMRRNPELTSLSPPSALRETVRPMEPYFEPHQFVPLLRRREPKGDSVAAIPRKFYEQRMSLRNDERESLEIIPTFCTNQQSRITRLPSISFLLAFSEPPFSQQEILFVERVQLPQSHPSNILPIPQPPLGSSAARYSLPYGAMPRRKVSPVSICKASLEIGEALLCRPKIDAKEFISSGSGIGSYHFSNMADENRNSRGSMRQGHRQIMSDAEKRARKALQQQRRRKHGPTREPRERFSEEEDRWLVMEKRRLEREPNKHWTDLESAHRAKFPNLKDRSLSGLQSRYYRIKKKFPVDPRECETFSRWDKEVADQFRESTESDGEPEDYEMRDSSMDEDSITGTL